MTKRTKELVRRSDFGGFFPARFNDLFDALHRLMDEGWENKYSDECKRYLVKEIAYRSFRRCLQFPTSIDTSKISTELKSGVLTCVLGKEKINNPEIVKIEIE